MHDKAVWEGSLIGTVFGLCAYYAVLIPAFPGWLTQAVVTIAVGAISVGLNHFIRRWIDRRWPNRRRKGGGSQDSES